MTYTNTNITNCRQAEKVLSVRNRIVNCSRKYKFITIKGSTRMAKITMFATQTLLDHGWTVATAR